MKSLFPLFLCVITTVTCFGQNGAIKSPSSRTALQTAYKSVKAFHTGNAPTNKVVKVIYFHAKDRAPLYNWQNRLNRVLGDISKYYQEEFEKYGLPSKGVPFEKSGDRHLISVVEGDLESKDYDVNSGAKIRDEISRKLAGTVDLSKDHVVVFTGLSYQRGDGFYVFNLPYWGSGSSGNGICFVADCDVLDSELLTDTAHIFKFTEQAVAFRESTVAEFNSWYIGGIAHEMGHMFGLPHDYGNPAELTSSDISLMGQFGSRHFRDYLWHGRKSATISAAGILQLLSHPVFTQSAGKLAKAADSYIPVLQYENNDQGVTIKTSLPADNHPYACFTLLRPADVSEYFGQSAIQTIGPGNQLNFQFGKLTGALYLLEITCIYPDGSGNRTGQFFLVGNDGIARQAPSLAFPPVDVTAFYNRLLKEEKTEETALKLNILETILHPGQPQDVQTATGNRLFLSEAEWDTAIVGWKEPVRNYYTKEFERTFFLENQGKIYEKGLYAHAPSSYTFHTGKKWNTFNAIAAMRDDLADEAGITRFSVWGDGRLLYTTPAVRTGQQVPVNVDIRNVNMLELKAESTGLNNFHCWSIWLNPAVER